MSTHDIQNENESTHEPRDERGCRHQHDERRAMHPHAHRHDGERGCRHERRHGHRGHDRDERRGHRSGRRHEHDFGADRERRGERWHDAHPGDERRGHRGHGRREHGVHPEHERGERMPFDERAPFGRGMHPARAFGRPMGSRGFGPRRDHEGFGPRPFGPRAEREYGRGIGRGFGPDRPAADDDQRSPRGDRARQRRLDRRILRTARIVAFAEHRAGSEAVERTMAASVSHADHEATMRTLRSIARAVRAEHLPERGHGRRRQG